MPSERGSHLHRKQRQGTCGNLYSRLLPLRRSFPSGWDPSQTCSWNHSKLWSSSRTITNCPFQIFPFCSIFNRQGQNSWNFKHRSWAATKKQKLSIFASLLQKRAVVIFKLPLKTAFDNRDSSKHQRVVSSRKRFSKFVTRGALCFVSFFRKKEMVSVTQVVDEIFEQRETARTYGVLFKATSFFKYSFFRWQEVYLKKRH